MSEELHRYQISTGDYASSLERSWMDKTTVAKLGMLTVEAPSMKAAVDKVKSLVQRSSEAEISSEVSHG